MSGDPLRADIEAAKARMSTHFGSGREINHLAEHLWEGELVEEMAAGAYGKGRGLLALTSRRVLFLLHGLITQQTEDFPIDKISSIQWSAGPMFGTITIFASGNKAEIHNVDKRTGRAIVDTVRTRISHRGPTTAAPAQPDMFDQLRRLGELRDAGVITVEEFDAKKAELLDRL